MAFGNVPGARRDPHRGRDARQPLKHQQHREHPIGANEDSLLVLVKQRVGPLASTVTQEGIHDGIRHDHVPHCRRSAAAIGQP